MKPAMRKVIAMLVSSSLVASSAPFAIAQTRVERKAPLQLTEIQMSTRLSGWGEAYAGSNVQLLTTQNGGRLWRAVATVPGDGPMQYASDGQGWYATTSSGTRPYARVHFTTDWGVVWSISSPLPLPVRRSDRLQLLFSPNTNVGWLDVTAGGMNSSQTLELWRTTDGGAHWSFLSGANPTNILLSFENSRAGWGEWSHAGSPTAAEFVYPGGSRQSQLPALFRTTDAGRTWQPEYVFVPRKLVADDGLAAITGMTWFGQKGFMEVSFASDGLPYLKWGLYATTDGGVRWSLHLVNGVRNNYGNQRVQVTFDTCSPQNLWEVVTRFDVPPGQAYVAKSSRLYHAGAITSRWTLVARTPVPFSTVQFATPQLGFALGINGALYDTANGGHSWRKIDAVQTSS